MAASFDTAADVYAKARPSYPAEAVDWLLEANPRDVLDLGAGTGKLTKALAGRVSTLHALDPSPNMLAQLSADIPEAITTVGTAEQLPYPDASLDAIVSGQTWHWVDPRRAVPEVRRVLRPGGQLGLIWNVRDESVPWVAALTEIMHGSVAEIFVADGTGMPTELGPMERLTVRWERPFTRDSLLDLAKSRSYVITATPERQADILARINDLLDSHPDLADPDSWRMPYHTEAFRFTVA